MEQSALFILVALASLVTGVIRFTMHHPPPWLDGILIVLICSCVVLLVSAWWTLGGQVFRDAPPDLDSDKLLRKSPPVEHLLAPPTGKALADYKAAFKQPKR